MTIVRFTQHSGYTYYYTDWDGDMSGEYVPLAEYQEVINLVNELGEEDVQNRLQIDKLKALIQRVIGIGNELFADPELSPNWHWKDYLMDLDKLVIDCREALK